MSEKRNFPGQRPEGWQAPDGAKPSGTGKVVLIVIGAVVGLAVIA